jgi:hypothetical protein
MVGTMPGIAQIIAEQAQPCVTTAGSLSSASCQSVRVSKFKKNKDLSLSFNSCQLSGSKVSKFRLRSAKLTGSRVTIKGLSPFVRQVWRSVGTPSGSFTAVMFVNPGSDSYRFLTNSDETIPSQNISVGDASEGDSRDVLMVKWDSKYLENLDYTGQGDVSELYPLNKLLMTNVRCFSLVSMSRDRA